ncbi:hypothetical protein NUACC21_79010 [Scytonema sp. NUACC21]
MSEQYRSSHIVLKPEKYEAIAQLANNQDRPISEVATEVVRLELETLEQRKQGKKESLERLNQRRLEYHHQHGFYPGDPVAEVRAEREKQIDTVIREEQ